MRLLVLGLPTAFLVAAALPAAAQTRAYQIALPAQRLSASLSQLAKQARTELLFSASQVGDRAAPAVRGRLTIEEALRKLLQGSDLSFTRSADGTIVIVRSGRYGVSEIAPPEPTPEILVVGRRTQNADIQRTESDIQPYQVSSRRELDNSHLDTPEDFLRTRLPVNGQMATASQFSLENIGSTRSEINLRGLGPRQTLVLLDGRRLPSLPASEDGFNQPDINAVPIPAIARVETITATAGGIYGPGATAGVVNVVLDRDYRGGYLAMSSGVTARGDAGFSRIEGGVGFTPDGGDTDVMLAFARTRQDSLAYGDRDYTERSRALKLRNDPAQFFGQYPVSGSVNIFGSAPLALRTPEGTIPLNARTTYAPLGEGMLASALLSNAGRIDITLSPDANGATRTLLPEVERWSFLLNVRRRLRDGVELFVDGLWMGNRGQSTVPFSLQSAYVADPQFRRFDGAVTVTFPLPGFDNSLVNRSTTSRVTVGGIVDLPHDWRANLDYTVGTARQRIDLAGDGLSADAFSGLFGFSELGAPIPNPLGDYPTFLSTINAYRTPNVLRYSLVNRMRQASARLSGPIARLPGGRATLSLLAERRREHVPASFVRESLLGTIVARPLPEVSQEVRSFSAELRAPLIDRESAVALSGLELQLAARNDRYRNTAPSQSRTGDALFDRLETSDRSATVYTAGLRFYPFRNLMVRGSVSTGILPPSIDQISARVVRSFAERDPRRGGSLISTDVPVVVGGSTAVLPERARSFSAGVVLTTADSRLRLSLDYTRIEKKDEIVLTSANGLRYLTDYGAVAYFLANEERFPERIVRLPLTEADLAAGYTGGLITRIDTTALNTGRTKLAALDLKAEYVAPLGPAGQVRFTTAATWQPEFKRRFDDQAVWYTLANYSQGALTWRGVAGVEWERGPLAVALDGQYYGRYRVVPWGPPVGQGNEFAIRLQGSDYIPAQAYVDLAISYRFSGAREGSRSAGMELRLGVQNLFDSSPPIVVDSGRYFFFAEAGYSSLADPRRRRFDAVLMYRF
ncbi:TonB-dependent receptor [Sphingomonas xinjiangensis]|uniref:Outer membrane receptor protein involved in Fe transport n=1 Tax=Sphingomonas xinjiangensis TaxID=643568 RepID=A0A840YS43_9SPHN|nr:TonB-dependent receptor [Sphingomonas xinjiangensis]MBB5712492.1 outer membrane receptor protein involved in Fe transport [Sphingomonas xinjiangensis]